MTDQRDLLTTPETTRTLSYVTHEETMSAHDAYVKEIGKTPRILIRRSVEFIEPGKRPGAWRKMREVDLSDWYEVQEWTRDEARMRIRYELTGGIYRTNPRSTEQWVRPTWHFHQWVHIRLCPTFAEENAAYLAYLEREREEGRLW